MLARTSSSSSSSYSDLSEIASVNVDDTVFDLSRASLDYKTVYAMAQEYAKSFSSVGRKSPDNAKLKKKLPALPSGADKKVANARTMWGRSQRQLPDPVDRSYHLRKY